MESIQRFFHSLYLNPRLFILLGANIGGFLIAYMIPSLLVTAVIALFLVILFVVLDIVLIYSQTAGISAGRIVPEKLSNGDSNPIKVEVQNRYSFSVLTRIIDEVPFQFQWREKSMDLRISSGEQESTTYELRPTERGEYEFGLLNVFAFGPMGLVRRRYKFEEETTIPCYPSFVQMRKYQLMAISNRLTEVGVKQIRRLGHTTEFEQIKEYVNGDDYRTVNWKATARTGKLMVNQFIDERAQNVYCIIDKSRKMQMPFEGLSLLDYAINAALVLSNISIYKHDKAGLITFAEKINDILPASSRSIQMNRIMEVLYNQKTDFLESDFGRLYAVIKRRISHRSLFLLFTNFETLEGLHRQLPYLQAMAKSHLLVVIFFENTELTDLLNSDPSNVEEIYIKTIGEDFAFSKRQIALELEKHGIVSLLTPPQNLTVNTLNKYLELKSRGVA